MRNDGEGESLRCDFLQWGPAKAGCKVSRLSKVLPTPCEEDPSP